MTIHEPKVGIKIFLPESLVFTCVILFLVSLLFGALVDPFDPFNANETVKSRGGITTAFVFPSVTVINPAGQRTRSS